MQGLDLLVDRCDDQHVNGIKQELETATWGAKALIQDIDTAIAAAYRDAGLAKTGAESRAIRGSIRALNARRMELGRALAKGGMR
jgi:hypothetical protein